MKKLQILLVVFFISFGSQKSVSFDPVITPTAMALIFLAAFSGVGAVGGIGVGLHYTALARERFEHSKHFMREKLGWGTGGSKSPYVAPGGYSQQQNEQNIYGVSIGG